MSREAADIFYRNRVQGIQYQQFGFCPQPALQGFNYHPPSLFHRNLLTFSSRPSFDYCRQQRPTFCQQNGNFGNVLRRSAQEKNLTSFEPAKDVNSGTRHRAKSECTTNSHKTCTDKSRTDQGKNSAYAIIDADMSEPDSTKTSLPAAISLLIQNDDLKTVEVKRKTVSIVHVETQTDRSEIDHAQKNLTTVSTQTQFAMPTEMCNTSTDLCSNCRRTLSKAHLLSPISPACHGEGPYTGQRENVSSSAEKPKREASYVKEFQVPSIKNSAIDRHRTCETYSNPSIDDSEEGNIGQLLKSLQALTIPQKYNGLLRADKGEEKDFQNSSTSKYDLKEQLDSNPITLETQKSSTFYDNFKSHGHFDTDAESFSKNSSKTSSSKNKTDSQRPANSMPCLGSQNPSLKAKGLPPPLKFGGKRVFKHIEDAEQVANKLSISHASGRVRSNTHVSKSCTRDETEGSNPSITAISKPIVSDKAEREDTLLTDFHPCNTATSNIPFVKNRTQQSICKPSLRSTDTDLQRVFASLKNTSSRETGCVNSSQETNNNKGPKPRFSKNKTPVKFTSKKVKKERREAESSSDPSQWQRVATSIKRLKTDPASMRLKTYCSQEMNAHLRKTIQERHPFLTMREVESVLENVISETTYLDGMQPSQILKGVDLIVESLNLDISERKAETEKSKLYGRKKGPSKHLGEISEDEEKSEAVWSHFTSANPYTTLDMIEEKRCVRRQD